MTRIFRLLGTTASLATVLAASSSLAHPLAPALLELRETGAEEIAVTWIQPRQDAGTMRLLLPTQCSDDAEHLLAREADVWRVTWTARCAGGIGGGTIAVEGLRSGGAPVLARVVGVDGTTLQWLLSAEAPSVRLSIASRDSSSTVALRFLVLGAGHLVRGTDHLAFLLGLFLLVRRRRALLVAVTAFTLGHSATLSLAVLGWFPLPPAVVEVGIAASILVVALELARGQGGSSLFVRRPWLVALGFGLLHGAGFANALHEAGLPRHDLAVALASFNLGIELAQIVVLLALAVARAAYQHLDARAPRWIERLPAEVLGAVAVFWLFERAAALL